MSSKYWVNNDGYIMYSKGDRQIIVCEMYPEHVQALTKIFESHDDLLAACKAAQLMLLQTDWNGDDRMNIVQNAIIKAK